MPFSARLPDALFLDFTSFLEAKKRSFSLLFRVFIQRVFSASLFLLFRRLWMPPNLENRCFTKRKAYFLQNRNFRFADAFWLMLFRF
jgi:hypothetical protein